MRRAIAPVLEGARLESVEIRDPRLVRPFDPVDRRERACRRARRRGRAPWQVFDCRVRIGSVSADSPPDDGVTASRAERGVGRRPVHACCSQIRQWIGRRLSRRAALRDVGAVRAGRARALSRRASRARAARAVLGGQARQATRWAPGAAQVGAARPANGRRPREHLRRRGALAEPAASAARRGQPGQTTSSAASTGRCGASSARGSSARGRRSATTPCPTAPTARCRTSSAPTDVGESRATAVGGRSRGSSSAGARRRSARTARLCRDDAGGALRRAPRDGPGRRVDPGVILYGSRAAGMFVREDSDWDVWLIVRVGAFADLRGAVRLRARGAGRDRHRHRGGPARARRAGDVARVEPICVPAREGARRQARRGDHGDRRVQARPARRRRSRDRRRGARRLRQQHLSVAQGAPSRRGDRRAHGWRRRRGPPARCAVRVARPRASVVEVPCVGSSSQSRSQREPSGRRTRSSTASRTCS